MFRRAHREYGVSSHLHWVGFDMLRIKWIPADSLWFVISEVMSIIFVEFCWFLNLFVRLVCPWSSQGSSWSLPLSYANLFVVLVCFCCVV